MSLPWSSLTSAATTRPTPAIYIYTMSHLSNHRLICDYAGPNLHLYRCYSSNLMIHGWELAVLTWHRDTQLWHIDVRIPGPRGLTWQELDRFTAPDDPTSQAQAIKRIQTWQQTGQ